MTLSRTSAHSSRLRQPWETSTRRYGKPAASSSPNGSPSGRSGVEQTPPHVDVVREALEAMTAELDVQPNHQADTAQLLLSIISLCWFPLVHGTALLPGLGMDPADPGFLEARKRHVVDLVLQGARELLALPAEQSDTPSLYHASTD